MFAVIKMIVSKKENKAHVKVGEQDIYCPTLKDLLPVIGSEIKKDDKGAEVIEDGLPVYEDDKANWLQGAVLAAVKAQARNKMIPGTATLKDGAKIAEDWDGLTAEGERGQGAGLALLREFKASFTDFISKQGLSEAATNTLIQLVGNKAALTLQQTSTKDKVRARLEKFAESLDAAQLEKLARPFEAALEACTATDDPLADM